MPAPALSSGFTWACSQCENHPMTPEPYSSAKSGPLKGRIQVPGDKSLSHRALIFGALAVGETRIEGLLEGDDVLATAAALRALGAEVERGADGTWHVWGRGVGGFHTPSGILDLGNSGTGARLLMGVVAQQPLRAIFAGDASLQSRPMGRVIRPLARMGMVFDASEGGRLPLGLAAPARLRPITYRLPEPSAQVKSAILLAGLAAPGVTTVIEPHATRDHTERMARAFGADIDVSEQNGERVIRVTGQVELAPTRVAVSADPSSAAFPVVAALVCEGSELEIPGVLMNPTRTGLYATLREMGAAISFENERDVAGELVADIKVSSSALKGVDVPGSRAPSMIDEYPVLAVAAAYAAGTTTMGGLGELRVKESDRLAAIVAGLKQIGVKVQEGEDSLTIKGCDGQIPGGGTVATHLDHRIAMGFLVAGLGAKERVKIDDGAMIATSFPSFLDLMTGLGARMQRANR